MASQPMPCFNRRHFSIKVDATAQIQQLLDHRSASIPLSIELWGIGGARHEGRRGKKNVIGRLRGVVIARVRDMGHTGMFEGEDEVDGIIRTVKDRTVLGIAEL